MPELMEVNDDYLVRQYLRTLKDKFARSSRLSRLSQEIDQLRGLIDDNEQYLMAIEAEFKRRYGNNWTSGPTYQDALVKTME